MRRGTVQERIEILEKTVAGLADLPEQMADVRLRLTSVESQIVQLGTRMEDGFSAIRRDLSQLSRSTDDRFGQVDRRFEQMNQTMNERFEQTNTHMRVLHEKLVSDIRTLYEGRQ
jgi:hypothetical protein